MSNELEKSLKSNLYNFDLHNAVILGFKSNNVLELTLLINGYNLISNEIKVDYYYPNEFLILKLKFTNIKNFKSNDIKDFCYLDAEILENDFKEGKAYLELRDYNFSILNINFNYDSIDCIVIDEFKKDYYSKWFNMQVKKGIFDLEKRENRDNLKKKEFEKFLNDKSHYISLHDGDLLKFSLINNNIKIVVSISNYNYIVNKIEDYVDYNKYTILELEFKGIKNLSLESSDIEIEYGEIITNLFNEEDGKFYLNIDDNYGFLNMSFNFDYYKWKVVGYFNDESYYKLINEYRKKQKI